MGVAPIPDYLKRAVTTLYDQTMIGLISSDRTSSRKLQKMPSRRRAFWIVLLFGPAVAVGQTDAPPTEVIDVVLRTTVTIDRPASVVWPFLRDLNAWKASIGTIEHVAGEAGAVGEVQYITPPDAKPESGYFIRTVELVPARRWVLKLFARDRKAFVGFADFALSESDGRTTLTYNVYMEYEAPATMTEEQRAAAEQIYEATKARLEAENLVLKRLVEGSS